MKFQFGWQLESFICEESQKKWKKNKFSKWKVEIKGCLDNINALLNSWCSEESIMVLFLYVLTDNNGLLLEVSTQVCVLDLDRIKMICTLHDFFLFIHKMIWPKEASNFSNPLYNEVPRLDYINIDIKTAGHFLRGMLLKNKKKNFCITF